MLKGDGMILSMTMMLEGECIDGQPKQEAEMQGPHIRPKRRLITIKIIIIIPTMRERHENVHYFSSYLTK